MKKKIIFIVFILFNVKVGAQVPTFISIDSLLILGRYHKALYLLANFSDNYYKEKKLLTSITKDT